MEGIDSINSERSSLLSIRELGNQGEEKIGYKSKPNSASNSGIFEENRKTGSTIFKEIKEPSTFVSVHATGPKKYIYAMILLLLLLGSITLVSISMVRWDTYEKPQPILGWRYKGINFISGKYCRWIKYSSPNSDISLANLRSTGATWVAIEISKFQTDLNSTDIQSTTFTPTDQDLIHVIKQAKTLGLSVFLRPTIDFIADPDHWRGDIGKFFTEENWGQWFLAYAEMLKPYLEIAQREGVDMVAVGTDLVQTSKREDEWRSLIKVARTIYTGKIIYSSNWGGEETDKIWWDAVDVIGIDAYYPLLPGNPSPSIDELIGAWNRIIDEGVYNMKGGLRNLSQHWNKSVIFTEIGYCSGQCPYGDKIDLESQRRHYVAVFEAFKMHRWFGGVFWWNWLSDPAFGGPFNYCFSPQFKPTEKVIRDYFGGIVESVQPPYPPVCPCDDTLARRPNSEL